LEGDNFFSIEILGIIFKECIDGVEFLYEEISSLKFMTFACEVEIKELISQVIEIKLFD
jgi:hypothetical protein